MKMNRIKNVQRGTNREIKRFEDEVERVKAKTGEKDEILIGCHLSNYYDEQFCEFEKNKKCKHYETCKKMYEIMNGDDNCESR